MVTNSFTATVVHHFVVAVAFQALLAQTARARDRHKGPRSQYAPNLGVTSIPPIFGIDSVLMSEHKIDSANHGSEDTTGAVAYVG